MVIIAGWLILVELNHQIISDFTPSELAMASPKPAIITENLT